MKTFLQILLCLVVISASSQDCTTYLLEDPKDKTVFASPKPMVLKADAGAAIQLFWVKNVKAAMLGVEVLNGGLCVNDSTTVTFIFADGRKVNLPHQGAANCDAKISIFFGGKNGNTESFKTLAQNSVVEIRVKLLSSLHTAKLSPDESNFVKNTFACLLQK